MKKLFGLNRDPMFKRPDRRDHDCGVSPGLGEDDTADMARQENQQALEEYQEPASSPTTQAAPQPL